MVYEAVLLFAVGFFGAWVFFFASGGADATAGATRHLLQLFIALVFAAYFLWCWLRGGQTLAMKAWKIRLVGVTPRKGPAPLRCLPCSWCRRSFRSSGLSSTATGSSCTTGSPERVWSTLSGRPYRLSTHHIIISAASRKAALGATAAENGGQFCSRPMCENRLFSMWKKMPSMMPRNTLRPTAPARA